MLAMVVVRDGVTPAGTDDAVAECAGNVMLAGSGTAAAARTLAGLAEAVTTVELGSFQPARFAASLAPLVEDDHVVLPSSPDGRDLAPHLALQLDRPLLAGAMQVGPGEVALIREGGRELHIVHPAGPYVATIEPGVRRALRDPQRPMAISAAVPSDVERATNEATVEAVLPPDPATIDLAEAPRIVAGGAGLDSPERFAQLARLGAALGASVGATRVITDRGWIEHQRQIGTTGVVVDPRLYIAFGISGAVQHTSGLGQPEHVISVNTDPHCPMMQLADLAVVADANAVLDALLERLDG